MRLTPDEYEQLVHAAEMRHVKPADLVRSWIARPPRVKDLIAHELANANRAALEDILGATLVALEELRRQREREEAPPASSPRPTAKPRARTRRGRRS